MKKSREKLLKVSFFINSIRYNNWILDEGASSIICKDNTFKSISNMSVGRHLKSQDIKDVLVKPHIGQDYTLQNQAFPLKGTICDNPYSQG
ncbi:hypothetical protein Hanom_Chr09g00767801 [Helianthus anomalus]